MTLQSSPRSDAVTLAYPAQDHPSAEPHDGPPADWDEIRARLRSRPQTDRMSMIGGYTGNLSLVGADAESRSLRVSWRPADGLASAGIAGLLAWVCSQIVPSRAWHWWQQHNPLVIQRLLVVVSILLLINLLANALT